MTDTARCIAADLRTPGSVHPRPIALSVVGAGRAEEVVRRGFLDHLRLARQACGFEYLRFHGLFHDDMGVARRGSDGRLRLSFQQIDDVFDALLDLGVRPFVELGFMPTDMASGDKTIFWWKANITPPKDMAEWTGLIDAAVRHWRDRYGEAEVRRWLFEVWNEPDLHFFWAGTQEQYQELYGATARTIKAIDPQLRVGGPATAMLPWIAPFIAGCAKRGDPLDFVSTHGYAVKEGQGFDEFGRGVQWLNQARRTLPNHFHAVRDVIRASAMPDLPLHITEWNSSYSSRDPVHDHYVNAAFCLDTVKGAGDAAATISYWTVSDIFEEYGPAPEPFHGGFGLINQQGLRKPAFHAHALLGRLGGRLARCEDDRAWVAGDDAGGVQVLAWDVSELPQDAPNQTYYRGDVPAAAKPDLAIELTGIAPGPYALSITRVGHRANDVFASWRDLGMPQHLDARTRTQLDALSAGTPEELVRIEVGADGRFSRRIRIRGNDVVLVELRRIGG